MNEDSPHITALRRQDKLNRLASQRFRVANGRVEKYKPGLPVQDIETVVAAVKKRERRANPQIGDLDERGIFLGVWEARDGDGNSLKKKFNVFAAPEDLPGKKTYSETLKHMAGLEDWHGYAGTNYDNDEEVLQALAEGSYNGGWFIPLKEMLDGKDAEDNKTMPDNLTAHHGRGAFKDSLQKAGAGFSSAGYYWSSTSDGSGRRRAIRFDGASSLSTPQSICLYHCRPVRMEPAP